MLASLARARPVLGAAPRRFHLFRGPDKLALTPGSRAARARDALTVSYTHLTLPTTPYV